MVAARPRRWLAGRLMVRAAAGGTIRLGEERRTDDRRKRMNHQHPVWVSHYSLGFDVAQVASALNMQKALKK